MSLGRNILIFNHSYSTQFVDITNQYAKLFDQPGDEVTVVYLTGPYDEAVKQRTLGKEVIFLDAPREVTRGLKISAIKQMLKLQKQKKFQVVVCHRYKPTYIMLWVSRFYKIPVFISVMHELGTLRSWARRAIIAALAPKNFIIAGVSNAVREDLRRDIWRLPPGRVLTLYNMIDVDFTEQRFYERAEAREKLHLPAEAFIFGTLGRLAKNKDQKTMIEAFARLKPLAPEAKLVILGDGQLEDELKAQVINLGLEGEVIFGGFVAEGYRYMKAFDTYVTSSIQEAFGRVLLEAMIAKVPTIATKVNGMPEVLGKTGILVKPACPEYLAEAMLKAYQCSPALRLTWGEEEYQRATKEFSIPKFSEIMGAILLPGLDSNQ